VSETLQELLFKLKAYDDGLIEFDADQMITDMKSLSDKFDAYVGIKKRIAEREATIENEIKQMQSAVKVLENNQRRIDERIKYLMEATGTEIIKGGMYHVLAVKKKDVELTLPDHCGSTHEFDYPEFVKKKVEYSWDKNAVKAAIKESPEEWASFGKQVVKTSLKFDVKK